MGRSRSQCMGFAMIARVLSVLFLILSAVVPVFAGERAIIVFDASGSMWAQIDGKPKIEIARETLDTVLQTLPPTTELGLIAYGHREKGSCADIELAVPPAAGTGQAIADFVRTINPKGKTPLSDAVRQAAEALRYTEEKATVILVTDGLETCNADPCALAKQLEATGVDFTAHVVGFGLTEEEGRQVACLAENTGGKYLQAKDAGELEGALAEAVAPPEPAPAPEPKAAELEFNVFAASYLAEGQPALEKDNANVYWEIFSADAGGNRAGDHVEYNYGGSLRFRLPAGKYVAHAKLGAIDRDVPFEAKPDEETNVAVVFDAGHVTLAPKFTDGGEDTGDVAFVEAHFGDRQVSGYGRQEFYAAAGKVDITGKAGAAEANDSFELKAGESIERDFVIPAGLAVAMARYAEGGPEVEGDGIFVEVLAAKKAIDGSRKGFGSGYGVGEKFYVPPGDFVLHGKLGVAEAEAPFSIAAGERVEPLLIFNAGVLAVTAPGAYRVDIREARKSIDGKQNIVSGGYDQNYTETLPAGDYEVVVTYEGDKAEKVAKATITAGERTEVAVE